MQKSFEVGYRDPETNLIWNGFEWVSEARYIEQRATSMPDLPNFMSPWQHFEQAEPSLYAEFGVVVTGNESKDDALEKAHALLLYGIGEELGREGLLETPLRAGKAWKYWTSGYDMDPASLLKVFEDGAQNYDQMVTVKDIPIYSKCEHHLADIFGTVTISYIPNGKIVGLSKLSRLADGFARRLQVQERLTAQIADALEEHLQPKGVGVLVKARHMCMESRGICQQGHHTITTALRGAILNEASTRAEFMALAR